MIGSSYVRRRAPFAACVLLAGTALAVHPTLARALGVDVWNAPALEADQRSATEESARLDADDATVRRRIEIKETLVADLIAGRAALADVTERFLELDGPRPANIEAVRARFAGATDHEKMARNVIEYSLPRATDADRAALAARLDTELRHLAAAGTH
ncbi:MAG: hypothetical protein FJ304_07355 [Planctomycetes bacterium]|nr:hypothetical protein [Planctomycetota bacterium]